MGKLIDQFFHAIQEWSQRTASSDEIIRENVLIDVGRYDEEDDFEYNLSMLQKKVEVLVEDIHLSERFLIVALIREVEHVFEDQLDDARKGEHSRQVMHARAATRNFIEKTTEQERQTPSFQKRLQLYEDFEQSVYPTPEKVAERKRFLDTWREVTTPILQPENLEM